VVDRWRSLLRAAVTPEYILPHVRAALARAEQVESSFGGIGPETARICGALRFN
jgi:hypothetical protein